MLRIAFVDNVEAAKDFNSGDVVRKTDFRGFFPTPYAGRVVFVDYRNGTVQVQWPWGSEQESPTELIRDVSNTVLPPDSLDQTYSSWSESRFRNDKAALKADQKWRKSLTASVVSRYETATMPAWRAACKAHHDGLDEIQAFASLSPLFDEFGQDAVRATVANLYEAASGVPERLALYWKDKGRRYKVTQREKSVGKIRCPRCSQEGMRLRTYRAGKKVLNCGGCGFSISPKDLIWDDSVPVAGPASPSPVPVPTVAKPGRAARKAALDLVHIAAIVAADNPSAAVALAEAAVSPLRRVSVVNPGVKSWEKHLDEMLAVLKSLDQELGGALRDLDDAEEFAKFFEDGIAEEEELRKILQRTKKLGKVASVAADEQTSGFSDFFKNMKKKIMKEWEGSPGAPEGVPVQYNLDEKVMNDFVEGSRDWLDASKYVEMEFAENREFFDGTSALLADMDDVRVSPTRDKIRAVRDRIPSLIKKGQDILNGAREHLRAQRVDIEGDDPVNPEQRPVDVEGDAPAPGESSHSEKDPKHVQWTVKHYVDMLHESMDDPDKMMRYLRELFDEVGPQLKTASVDPVRAEARKVIGSKLVRLAKASPSARRALLPILRTAASL